MAEQNEHVEEVVNILIQEFNKKKQGANLNPHAHNYWAKMKKVLSEEVVNNLESDPEAEATKEALINEYTEQFKNQRIIAHTALFVNQYQAKK